MHVLIGLVMLAGLVAFAFGGGAARNFVRGALIAALMLTLAGLTYVAVDAWRELHPRAEMTLPNHDGEHLL